MNLSKKLITAVSAIACVSGLATTLSAAPIIFAAKPAAAQSNPDCDPTRSVQVSGSATVEVVPDEVFIRLGIQAKDASAEQAQTKVASTSQTVIKAMKVLGVSDKKLTSDFYYAQPIYTNYEDKDIKAFVVNYTLGVVITDSRKANDVIAAAFKAGATSVDSVEFRTSQLRKYRDEARVAAMTAAAEKAQLLAKAGNAQIGCTLKIEEVSAGGFVPFYKNSLSQNSVSSAGGNAQGESPELPLSLGTLPVKAEVVVSYSLK